MEKLIFPVSSVTQKEQLSGLLIFQFNFDANLGPPNIALETLVMKYVFIISLMLSVKLSGNPQGSVQGAAQHFID